MSESKVTLKTAGEESFKHRIEQSTIVRSIRSGLVNMIPVLIIGAFALVINQFPIEAYQTFINAFLNGFIAKLSNFVNKATFGVLSIYMTFSISRSYMKIKADPQAVSGGAIIAALISFFLMAGAYLTEEEWGVNFGLENMGPKSMFLAIITGLGASALYLFFDRLLRKRKRYLLSAGADREFNRMLSTLLPILLVALIFAVVNLIVIAIFDVDSFRALLAAAFDRLFAHIPDGFFKGFIFVLLSSVLWFFGIHGSDTLETVMQTYFAPNLAVNQAAAVPSEVLTKEFFDCFVLMGGCGATICLLIAIVIFSKNRARRGLGYTAAFSMVFNINELMVFGLPIVFNPVMLIPFLTVPLVCYSTSYIAISTGIVPMITSSVQWTTPIILGGYTATGSFAGALLQLFNLILGVLIYLPFLKILDRQSDESLKNEYKSFLDYFRKNESELNTVSITSLGNVYGDFAKSLCADVKHGLKTGAIKLAYQPQYDYSGKCIGVETLMRYEHRLNGFIYPPLVIKLADEGGFLPEFEEYILAHALNDKKEIYAKFGEGIKLSVNVTGTTVVTQRFLQYVKGLKEEGKTEGLKLCIEITEQAALSLNEESLSILKGLREMGVELSIDDFSMGSTSIQYLKDNLFDELKLDGSLVKGLNNNKNCREIIQSITGLASTLNISVLAEYVETEEIREALHAVGCDRYQGYLYSPAVFLDEKKGE